MVNDSPIVAAGCMSIPVTVGALADHARYDRHAELHKLVGDTVVGYGLDAGIAVYHFLYGIGGRVAMVCSLDIGVEYPAQLGKGLYERKSFFSGQALYGVVLRHGVGACAH